MNKRNIITYITMFFIVVFTLYSVIGVNTFVPPQQISQSNTDNLFNPTTNVTNVIIINITNNITSWNNITNNVTTIVNLTNNVTTYVNVTNNLTNNVYVSNFTNNVTNWINITNNFTYYAGLLVINNNVNVTNNITNNITTYINITNNITNDVTAYITNNITNNLTNYITLNYTIELVSNTSNNISINIFNITNIYNYSYYYNDSLLWYELGLKLNITDQRYNDTLYCNAKIQELNNTIINISNVNNYGEIYNVTSTTRTLTTINTWYNITSFQSGYMNNFYYIGNGILVCNHSGLYQITYNIIGSLSANNNLQYRIIINDSIQIDKSIITIRYSTGYYNPATYSFIHRLNKGDDLRLQVLNLDSSGRILSEDARNIIIKQIDN